MVQSWSQNCIFISLKQSACKEMYFVKYVDVAIEYVRMFICFWHYTYFLFFLEASLQSVFCKIIGNDYWTSKLLVFLIEVFLNIKAK